MIYKKFQELNLSTLGLGCMRLPLIDDSPANIDETATAEMVEYAIEHGINYFDTAFGYHDGMSEIVMGKVLKKYPRDKFYLASKFPGFNRDNLPKVKEIFEKQLEKCQVEYFDFYLFHNLCDANVDGYLDPKYGIFDYLMEQKKNGRIRHLGFSAHGDYNIMKRFLEAYGKDMEFCQLQINWLDWTFQEAKEKIELVSEYNIPIWVMEPLRGGKLVNLADKYVEKLSALRPNESIPGWSFRFLQSLPEVVLTLSGMSNMDQLKENIKIYETDEPLNDNEMKTILEIADDMINNIMVPCTGCGYCTTHCPQELDIPKLIDIYNRQGFTGGAISSSTLNSIAEDKWPSACIGCRSCEQVCPQLIKISETMSNFSDRIK